MRRTVALAVGLVAALLGCESSPKQAPVKKDGAVAVAVAKDAAVDALAKDAGPARKVFVTGAGRCGECHEKMFDEWELSAHAKSTSSAFYKAAVLAAKDASCDRCHAPLSVEVPHDLIASEGVTCDVCHTLREPAPSARGGAFRLAIDDMVKYGPRCDLKDHYFHRMGCSNEHREAVFCGSCHWWEPGGVPVYTEYKDWKAGPAAATPCQDCHMPKSRAALATGSPVRTGVPHHGLLGLATDLRTRALGLEVTAKDDHGALAVTVALTNVNAGHPVPAGAPERRIVVRVRVHDETGAEIASETRALGRILVDDKGAEVPFWQATRVGDDTRIAPSATWREAFAFHPTAGGDVEIRVVYRGVSEAVAKQLALTEVEEVPLTGAKIPFGAATVAGRAKLPKIVTSKPPPPGKRGKGQGAQ